MKATVRRRPGRAHRAPTALATALVVCLLGVGCKPVLHPVPVLTLTSVDGGSITVSTDGSTSEAKRAPTGGDARILWAATASPERVDEQACATWRSLGHSSGQPGIALRVRDDDGRIRAITVTNNVIYGLRWGFNVHVWDTDRLDEHGNVALVQISSTSLKDSFYADEKLTALPWRMCAQARGNVVEFKVWPLTRREPMWGTSGFSGRTRVPDAFVYPGRPGWFAAHLGTDDTLVQDAQTYGPPEDRHAIYPTLPAHPVATPTTPTTTNTAATTAAPVPAPEDH